MRVFYRTKTTPDGHIIPYNYNIANALEGALECGLETRPYKIVSEIYDDYNLGDIVLDGIDQVQMCLKKFNIVPKETNYPEVLNKYMGRKVWKDTINNINTHPELWGNFVKPIKEKAFTGRVINSAKDLIGCGSCYENYEVLVSEPVDFIYECRGFVYYDELIDLRPYKGSPYMMNLIDTNVISNAMKDWKKWKERPNACSLDFGVISKTIGEKEELKTVLIEMNLPYALGCYGLYSNSYIKLISAYISQISGVPDELDFRKYR